jgi:hypothetical protein
MRQSVCVIPHGHGPRVVLIEMLFRRLKYQVSTPSQDSRPHRGSHTFPHRGDAWQHRRAFTPVVAALNRRREPSNVYGMTAVTSA